MNNEYIAKMLFPNIKYNMEYYIKKYPERKLKDKAFVTRFAPSPTGFVHIGSLFTAFIARKVADETDGCFFLRIEDTDQKREVTNGIVGIIEDLKKFNINFDEGLINEYKEIGDYGPYLQSKRKDIYQSFVYYLVASGKAYPCFCTEEGLNLVRTKQQNCKERIGYYGKYAKCRRLPLEEIIDKIENNEKYVIRLKSKGNYNNKIVIKDLVKGRIEFPENDLDVVILKSDGLPTYHFAHVIDDYLMHTTHVIRGDEWLSSLPIHIQLFEELKLPLPNYAHIPPLMKKEENTIRKISKRKDPEAAVDYYFKNGIPCKAIKLYLMTIANTNFESWYDNNKDKSFEEFSFNFNKMSSSGSVFDVDKLLNISKNYLAYLKAEDLYAELLEYYKLFDKDFYNLVLKYKDYTIDILNIERERKKPRKDYAKYSDVKAKISYMYDELYDLKYYNDVVIKDFYEDDMLIDYINNYYDLTDTKEVWYDKLKILASKYSFAKEVKDYKDNPNSYKGHIGDVCELVRVAVTKNIVTPDLYEIMLLLGKDRIKKRIYEFCNYLSVH